MMQHADLPDAGRIDHFQIDQLLPTPAEKNAIANLPLRTFGWVISDPAVETVGQVRIPWNCTVTRVDANTLGGTSCTFNIEERNTLGTSGTDILSLDMTADANGETVTSGFNNASLAAGNHLAVDISAVSGVVDFVSITVTVQVD